jgi:DNA helicase II / ATP-dependent DNA helicase PcrA
MRVAHLLVNGIHPHRILLLTFTRRAAKEMTQRVRQVASSVLRMSRLDLPWSGTFHSVGARLLREYAQVIGLRPSFTILDRSDAADLMNVVRHDLDQSKKESRFPQKDTCLSIYSLAVNSGVPLDRILATQFPWCADWEDELRTLFTEYGKAKRRQNVLDYDDLLLFFAEMLNDRVMAEEIGGRFDHVLVDEYQDTNLLQVPNRVCRTTCYCGSRDAIKAASAIMSSSERCSTTLAINTTSPPFRSPSLMSCNCRYI